MNEQQPVAWLELRENLPPVVVPKDLGTPVYTHPQRTLTDEVIADLWHQTVGFPHHFARAVERWLKGEK